MGVPGVGRPVVHVHPAPAAAAVHHDAEVLVARVGLDAELLHGAGLGPEEGDAEQARDDQRQEGHDDDGQEDH